MIRVVKVSKRFGDKIVLDNVSFEVTKNENLVILGPTGTGKTVLLKIMIGLLKPDQGEVYFDSKCVQSLSDPELFELRKNIGFIFQSTALFDSMTVFENIALGLEEHTKLRAAEIKEKVDQILKIIDMSGTEDLYPHSLSGGMKRLVSIGRSLALDPEYFLYDEPTSGLDPNSAQNVCNLIIKLRDEHKKCAIIVTHDLDSARQISDNILMLRKGKIYKTEKDIRRLYGD
ncbi:MAG: ATP-binding cassette domain-containing protein [candidate division WOR-3 bacterium]